MSVNPARRRRAFIFTGGVNHPFDGSAPALARLLENAGFIATVSTELDPMLDELRRNPDALLVIYALRWTMTQSEKYAPDRARWAYAIESDCRKQIVAHVVQGGGLLGLHTACICFDDWAEWGNLLGARWVWGHSFHPAPSPLRVLPAPDHWLTKGLPPFEVHDELYFDLQFAADAEFAARALVVDAASATTTSDQCGQICLLTRQTGAGRIAFDSLGHDAASLSAPSHRVMLERASRWAAGLPF